MEPIEDHLERERTNFDFFLDIPQLDRTQAKIDVVKGSQLLRAAVRVLRRMRRLRRNALFETDEPVVRRPGHHCQCHGLLVDLRRQPADDAVDNQ